MLRVKCLHCLTPRASIVTVLQVPGLSTGRTISSPFTVGSVEGGGVRPVLAGCISSVDTRS